MDPSSTRNENGSAQWERQVDRLLAGAPAYRSLDANTQQELRRDLTRVASYFAVPESAALGTPYAGQLGPDLSRLLRQDQPAPAQQPVQQPAAAQPQPGAPAPSQGPVSRVGDVAKATLNAIDFPQFVSSLIQGTFQAIVEAHIQQMEAYATC